MRNGYKPDNFRFIAKKTRNGESKKMNVKRTEKSNSQQLKRNKKNFKRALEKDIFRCCTFFDAKR